MNKIRRIPYRTRDHGDFKTEWGLHQGCSEWWYVTGYLYDEDHRLYSYQYTLITVRYGLLQPYIQMLALTDISQQKHYYTQAASLSGKRALVLSNTLQWDDTAGVMKGPFSMKVSATHADFAYDLNLDYGKGAFWHCDNGVLQMGLQDVRQTTIYYSYTNMPTTGTLALGGKTLKVSGKSWFDKQGGTYSPLKRGTHWEWFSLRFFDDEEMMLFSFPQSHYQDGTFIPRQGPARRLNQYVLTPTAFVTANHNRFSAGWRLDVPGVKDEVYTITPLIEGQINLAYFEQLAGIYNRAGEQVGLCFVELLPGVLNEKIDTRNLLRSFG
jgi:predicted secreted hydrolase